VAADVGLAVRDPDPFVAAIAFDALRRLGGQTPPGGN
jgi:hypothetical protein